MKKFYVILILLVFFCVACHDPLFFPKKKSKGSSSAQNEEQASTDDGVSETSESIFYLAKNIIFDSASTTRSAHAQQTVDTETKINASQVIFEKTDDTEDLEGANLQDVVAEIKTLWKSIYIGTWTIVNLNHYIHPFSDTGQITINSDGTYTLDSGAFAAIGLDESQCIPDTSAARTWREVGFNLIEFTHSNLNPTTYKVTPIPNEIKVNDDGYYEVMLVGSGGCLGGVVISILTKTTPVE